MLDIKFAVWLDMGFTWIYNNWTIESRGIRKATNKRKDITGRKP
jgi:hypothetical protein